MCMDNVCRRGDVGCQLLQDFASREAHEPPARSGALSLGADALPLITAELCL